MANINSSAVPPEVPADHSGDDNVGEESAATSSHSRAPAKDDTANGVEPPSVGLPDDPEPGGGRAGATDDNTPVRKPDPLGAEADPASLASGQGTRRPGEGATLPSQGDALDKGGLGSSRYGFDTRSEAADDHVPIDASEETRKRRKKERAEGKKTREALEDNLNKLDAELKDINERFKVETQDNAPRDLWIGTSNIAKAVSEGIRNYASTTTPESMKFPVDTESIKFQHSAGVFQQFNHNVHLLRLDINRLLSETNRPRSASAIKEAAHAQRMQYKKRRDSSLSNFSDWAEPSPSRRRGMSLRNQLGPRLDESALEDQTQKAVDGYFKSKGSFSPIQKADFSSKYKFFSGGDAGVAAPRSPQTESPESVIHRPVIKEDSPPLETMDEEPEYSTPPSAGPSVVPSAGPSSGSDERQESVKSSRSGSGGSSNVSLAGKNLAEELGEDSGSEAAAAGPGSQPLPDDNLHDVSPDVLKNQPQSSKARSQAGSSVYGDADSPKSSQQGKSPPHQSLGLGHVPQEAETLVAVVGELDEEAQSVNSTPPQDNSNAEFSQEALESGGSTPFVEDPDPLAGLEWVNRPDEMQVLALVQEEIRAGMLRALAYLQTLSLSWVLLELPPLVLFWIIRPALMLLSLQVYVACSRERTLWLSANGLAREYLVEYVHMNPSSKLLPGVDMSFALGLADMKAISVIIVQTADIWFKLAVLYGWYGWKILGQ